MATIDSVIQPALEQIRDAGLYKDERIITSPQGVAIRVGSGEEVLNFCANNYLGLSSDPAVIDAAAEALRTHGFGLSSVRFICGTQDLHKRLEQALARFLGTDDAILYTSCFDANGGLFETLLQEGDAVLSDALNHASIIDGIRLCKAARYRYAHADMDDLKAKLNEAAGARLRLIATDGVFSMDGDIAPLDRIVELARKHDALVMVDDSHATGFIGATGRGRPSTAACRARSTSSPARWARRSAAPPAGSPRRGHRSWSCSGSDRGRTCSATRCRLPWPRPAWRYWNAWTRPRSCATGWRRTPPTSGTR